MGALKEAARRGRGGDTRLGHLSNGDVVFPAEHVDEKTKKTIVAFMKSKGIKNPSRFIVGDPENTRNPKTRLPMFADDDGGGTSGSGPGGESPGAAGAAASSGMDSGGASTGGAGSSGAPGGITDSVGGPVAADPSVGSTTPGIGVNAGNLTGSESTTAVESGGIPGTPQGTPDQNSLGGAMSMGQAGAFGQPTAGPVLDTVGNLFGAPIGDLSRSISQDPVGTIAALGINGLLGLTGPVGLGLGLASRGLTGQSIGQNAVGVVEGRGIGSGGLSSMSGTPGGVTPGAPSPASTGQDTGEGLRALGGGVGVNLDEMLKNRLGGSQ